VTHLEKGLIFNVQKYSIQDGPGIRTTIIILKAKAKRIRLYIGKKDVLDADNA